MKDSFSLDERSSDSIANDLALTIQRIKRVLVELTKAQSQITQIRAL